MPMDVSSLYPQPAAPFNPLAQAANAFELQQRMNQNRLFQQEFNARQAIGQAYQHATNPLTGELDTSKLSAIVSQDPRASYLSPEVAQEALARKQAQIGVDTSQQELAVRRQAAANQVLGSVLSHVDANGNFTGTAADVLKSLHNGYAQQMMDPELTQSLVNEFAGLSNSQDIQNHLRQYVIQGMSPEARASTVFGSPTMIDTGAGKIIANVSPVAGVHPIATVTENLSPAYLAEPMTWTDAGGVQHQGTRAQYLQMTQGGGVNPVSIGPAAVSGAPSMPGRYPSNPAGMSIPGPAPGVPESKVLTAGESAKQGVSLQSSADNAVNMLKPAYQNMRQDLVGFEPGPGADWTKVSKAFINRFDPQWLKNAGIQFDPKEIASQEGFAKLANQIALAQGAQSDMHLGIAEGANPNTKLSKLGIQQILGRLEGAQDAVIAKNQAWQAHLAQGGSPADYGQWSTQFNKGFDPRLFQMVYMSPAEREEFVKGLSQSERRMLFQTKQAAQQNGWLR